MGLIFSSRRLCLSTKFKFFNFRFEDDFEVFFQSLFFSVFFYIVKNTYIKILFTNYFLLANMPFRTVAPKIINDLDSSL